MDRDISEDVALITDFIVSNANNNTYDAWTRLRLKVIAFLSNQKNQIPKIEFPELSECEENVRQSMVDKCLSAQDRHCIGTAWAFIERKIKNQKS